MNCAEFQKDLPEIIEGGGTDEQRKHLASCPVCADLVQDLRYSAEQAKLLVPMEDPAPRVWDGIERSLKQEGLWPAHGGPANPRPFLVPQRARLAWPMMAAVVHTTWWPSLSAISCRLRPFAVLASRMIDVHVFRSTGRLPQVCV